MSRWAIVGVPVVLAVRLWASGGAVAEDGVGPRDRAIFATLEKPLPLKLKGVPLDDALQQIRKATASAHDSGLPIRIDPGANRVANAPLRASVTYEAEPGEPLGEALTYMLGARGLAYRVKDGVLWITVMPLRATLLDRRKETRALRARLDRPIDLKFEKAPLDDVLRFIKEAGAGAGENAIPLYVDPVGLEEAGASPASPVSIDVKGVPLARSLRDLLGPLGLTYLVKDGLVTITSAENEIDNEAGEGPSRRP